MADGSERAEVDVVVGEDFYALLNVSKDASVEDVKGAYKRLCVIYHPDKHREDEDKAAAELMFNKIHKAYSVLTDPHKRAIYDLYGEEGLRAGLEVGPHLTGAREIREEYERLKRQREEERRQARANAKGTVLVNIDATQFVSPYELEEAPSLEIGAMSISQSVELPLTEQDTLYFGGMLAAQNGTGGGNVNLGVRKQLSSGASVEVEGSAGNGTSLSVKGTKSLTKYCFGTVAGTIHDTARGMGIGLTAVLAHDLGSGTMGYLTWKLGMDSSMNTTVIRNTDTYNLSCVLQIGVPRSFIGTTYIRKLPDSKSRLRVAGRAGTTGLTFEYGGDRSVGDQTKLGVNVVVGYPAGVSVRLRVTRAGQNYIFPVLLSQTPSITAAFYGTVVPSVVAWAVYKFVVVPYRRSQNQEKVDKLRKESAEAIQARRQEAEAAVRLMREAVQRKVAAEQDRNGLIIVQAWYGKLTSEGESETGSDSVIDVTIPLQCLVKDSQLHLPAQSKSSIVGFYDPCVGEDKSLRIRYQFKGKMHAVTIADTDAVALPKRSHMVA